MLARDVLATHLKRWTLAEMVRTDIFRRGVPWMLLIKRTATVETDLNVKSEQKACVVLTGLTLLATLACAATPWAGLVAAAAVSGDHRAQSRILSLSWYAARDWLSRVPPFPCT